MISDVKNLLRRQNASIIQDALGAVALIVILLVALHFPGHL
ncbi:MAG: hypothetical protein ACI9IV_002346 [Paracoccaceae bacterium]|jgi:hypothetical protein